MELIDYQDYINYTQFVICHDKYRGQIALASKFLYWNNTDNPPLLGSATDRMLNPKMQQQAHEYAMSVLTKNQSTTWIFSDGSVSGPNHDIVGGGYIITKPDKTNNPYKIPNSIIEEHSIKLPKGSIAMAELISMLHAFRKISSSTNKYNSPITAFCDNKSVVNIANSLTNARGDLNKYALELHQILFKLRQNIPINICWIPAHCNIHLHDRADFLATHAHDGHKTGSPGKAGCGLP